MQGVILAGGKGTRLRPLTYTCPKPLLPVANVPILRRIIDSMPPEIDEVIIAVNYRLDDILDYFAHVDVGRKVTIVEEKDPLGTAGAIKNVAEHITGTFVVFNGDILDSLDIAALIAAHRDAGADATLALWHVSDPRHFGIMDMDGDRIKRFVEKPATRDEAPSDLANAGTYVLEPKILDLIPRDSFVSIERDTYPKLLAEGGHMLGFPFEGYWVDCGRPDTFLRANAFVLAVDGRSTLLGEHTANRGATFEDWAVVGAHCELGEDVEVTRSVLFDGVRVGTNVVIKDSIIGRDVTIADDAALVDCVVADGMKVDKGLLLKNVKLAPESAEE